MNEACLLTPWMEAIGTLHRLAIDDVFLLTEIGPVRIYLPPELEVELRPHVGEKVAVLRTDDPARQYRIRFPGR